VKEVISYLLAIAGVGVMGWLLSVLSNVRKYAEARTMVTHMLQTQPNRAELICRSQKGTFGEAIAAAMKTCAMAKSNDINIIVMTTKPGYDGAVPQVKMYWKDQFGKVKLGGGLSLGGAAMAIGIGVNPAIHIILAILSIGVGVYWLMMRADAERGLMHARLEVLPEVRYGFMPTP
jgi:hypothetical protein